MWRFVIPFLMAVLLLGSGGIQSQRPIPTPTKASDEPKSQSESSPKHSAVNSDTTQSLTPTIALPITSNRKIKSTDNREKNDNESSSYWWSSTDIWLAIFSGLLLFVVFLQLIVVSLQFKWIRRQVKWMAASERAYVKMSHLPPGVKFTANGFLIVDIKVSNHGRTPAKVTDVFFDATLRPHDAPVPEIPDYNIRQREFVPNAFLVTDDHFFLHENPIHLVGKRLEDAKSGAERLVVFGYVDYIDTFGQRHRGGYARDYRPIVGDGTQNNLFYVTEERYNYDRPRKPGEGIDWDKPQT